MGDEWTRVSRRRRRPLERTTILSISVLEYEDGWFPLKTHEPIRGEDFQEQDDFSDDDSIGISDTVMIEDEEDEVEEGEIVGDDEEKVEDSFRRDTAGDGKLDQAGELAGDDSGSIHESINGAHGENEKELGEDQ
ncbi:hypothetical protein L2E82_03193 [Cichorium intybus]|uniref:Uncharacterized protein n=1 Tax=Cichorium intybus TaxID=13427 RepID=A0ACB9H4I5_CICIN|nr:hypothetical protein L2E82_03193 [Cichorium intybus]